MAVQAWQSRYSVDLQLQASVQVTSSWSKMKSEEEDLTSRKCLHEKCLS